MPKYVLIAKDGHDASSSREYSAADLRALRGATSCFEFIGELTNTIKRVGACRKRRRR